MEREQGNEDAEADEEHEKDVALRIGGNKRGRSLQDADIEAPSRLRQAAIKHDQAEQQNETAGRQIDRNFPGGHLPIPRPPDSNEQKRRDQCQLVKSVEEKEIERSECAHGASRDEK